MKIIKKSFALLLIPMLVFVGGCEKYIECKDCIQDPNNPTTTTPPLLMSVLQVGLFQTYSGNLARVSSIFTQHMAGTDFQYADFGRYSFDDQDFENEWNQIYGDGLINYKEMIDDFGAENPWYAGISKVIAALYLGIATDWWGDVPWSEALKGLDNLNPAYDAQEDVYVAIQGLLDDAIADLSQPEDANLEFPGTDDFVYGGDVQAWIRIAWVLKARFANHLSKKDPSGSAQDALDYLTEAYNAGFASTADDANTAHGTAGNEQNQWSAFESERGGYIKCSATMIDFMKSINDPRLPFYADTTGSGTNDFTGTPLGTTENNHAKIGPYFASTTSPAPIATYVEAKFIEAEANMRLNNTQAAADAHNEAVKAHVALITGGPDATFEAAQASETAGTITMEKIMTHKWLAMFTQFESWTDWRRTNIPDLTPDPRAVTATGQIPRRMVTPQGENVNNSNAPTVTNLEKPVWWDE